MTRNSPEPVNSDDGQLDMRLMIRSPMRGALWIAKSIGYEAMRMSAAHREPMTDMRGRLFLRVYVVFSCERRRRGLNSSSRGLNGRPEHPVGDVV